jgi:hypothetical protein
VAAVKWNVNDDHALIGKPTDRRQIAVPSGNEREK